MHILIGHNWKKIGIIKLAAVLFIAFLITSCESESEVSIVNNSNDELLIVLYRPNSIYDTANFSITSRSVDELILFNEAVNEFTKYKIDSSNFEGKPLVVSFKIKPKSTMTLYSFFNAKGILKQRDWSDKRLSANVIADKLIIKLKHGGSIVADKEGVDKLFSHYEKSFLGGREAYRLVID